MSTLSAAGDCVLPHTILLVLVGVMRARQSSSRAHGLYRAVALAATATYLLQESIYAYQERGDMAKLSRVMFLLLCHITSLAKQIVFHTDAKRIDALVTGLDDIVFSSGVDDFGSALMGMTARRAWWLLCMYAGTAVFTCLLWIVFPVLDRAAGRHVEFYFWTGLPTNSLPIITPKLLKFGTRIVLSLRKIIGFFNANKGIKLSSSAFVLSDSLSNDYKFSIELIYSYYVTSLVGIANTTMDAFIATILYQCQTQLRILRMNLENLVERANIISNLTGENEEKVFMKLFVQCLRHYDRVIQINTLLQDIFGVPILVQFGIGGWILCMAAYKLVSLSVLSLEFASMTLFLMCILTELFLYCYYGNELAVESEQVAGSVYAAQWLKLSPAARRAMLLLMARAHRPLRPTAGRIVALSLETFLTILKSSYTFYAVLRQTK